MSLQDDAFDLLDELEGDQKKSFERIWKVFCQYEAENYKLSSIVNGMKKAIGEMFKEEE